MTIDQFNFAGKKAIVRVDFNVPLDENGKITDDTRIRGALPTLKKVLADGGSLIIMSHMGKPKGKVNAKYSLSQIVDAVSEKLGVPVQFAPDCAKAGDAAAALKPGEVLLLENLRFYPEEEGKPVGIDKEDPAYEDAKKAMKASQKEFAKTLASYADCYINDAFGTAHRKHASTAVIADYFDADNKMLGYLMEKEVQAVDNILKDIKRPFTAIMGGSKVSTKIGIIENLMDKVDNLILCGGMTYTFAKAQGGKIGNSIVEDDKFIRQKFTINANVILGALGMVCLNIGSNISFGGITAGMATGGNYNVDTLTVISSLADMCSSFFGGAPVESIISATANAPHAVWAGVAMMVVIGVILLLKLLPKIGKYVPASSIAGFLFVLGIFKTVVLDAPSALATNAAVGGTTMVVTAVTNPFLGMLAGVAAKFLGL
mgnify:CR=1 FL=1